jgi:hypothetical protein
VHAKFGSPSKLTALSGRLVRLAQNPALHIPFGCGPELREAHAVILRMCFRSRSIYSRKFNSGGSYSATNVADIGGTNRFYPKNTGINRAKHFDECVSRPVIRWLYYGPVDIGQHSESCSDSIASQNGDRISLISIYRPIGLCFSHQAR